MISRWVSIKEIVSTEECRRPNTEGGPGAGECPTQPELKVDLGDGNCPTLPKLPPSHNSDCPGLITLTGLFNIPTDKSAGYHVW